MKIINFGSLNIDRVYSVDHLVRPGETITSSRYRVFAGGKGLNQSIALARAGARVLHAGKIGQDGLFLKDLLQENGVDVSLLFSDDGPGGHAIIQVDSGAENAIVLFGGANRRITQAEIDTVLAAGEAGDFLLLQNEINGIAAIIEGAAARGLRVMLNPAPITRDVERMPLDLVEWLVVNEIEGGAIVGETATEAILSTLISRYPGLSVLLTLGGRGAVYASGDERIAVAARKVTPVDTTGAGDTFIGYFLAGLAAGMAVGGAMERAVRAAALCVTRSGAADSIPWESELTAPPL